MKKMFITGNQVRDIRGPGLPNKIPSGWYLAHNHVGPYSRLGMNGFRAWMQEGDDNLVKCDCDFGGVANAKLHTHYRIKGV